MMTLTYLITRMILVSIFCMEKILNIYSKRLSPAKDNVHYVTQLFIMTNMYKTNLFSRDFFIIARKRNLRK